LLRQGQTGRAAWRTLPPRQRSGLREDDPDINRKLDARIASEMKAPGGPGGILSQFLQQQLVRTITEGGPATTFAFNGVKSWEAEAGGYRVTLSYRITTPECWFDTNVVVQGSDSPRPGEGRQWYIDLARTSLDGEIKITEAGQAFQRLMGSANACVMRWQEAMMEPTSIEVYLLTLPADQRKAARALLSRREPLGAVAGGWASCQGRPDLVVGFQRTCRGEGVVKVEPDSFPDEDLRKKVTDRVRSFFAPGIKHEKHVRFQPGSPRPTRREKDGVLQLGFDFVLQDMDNQTRVMATVLVEAERAALEKQDSSAWRFVHLNLTGAQQQDAAGRHGPQPMGP
jgi:hypothetical protein